MRRTSSDFRTAAPARTTSERSWKAGASLGGARAFYKQDLLAYRDGKALPDRAEGEAQHLILDATQIANMLGLEPSSLPSYRQAGCFHLIPEHSGQVGGRYYWLRGEVRDWAAKHRPVLINSGRV